MINFYFKLVEIAVSVRQSDGPIKNHKSFRDSSMIYFFTSSWFLPSWNCVFLNRWIYFILKSPADNSAISICQSRWLITGYSAGCLTRRWASSHSFTLKSDSNSSLIGLNSQKIAHGLKKSSADTLRSVFVGTTGPVRWTLLQKSSELRSAKDPKKSCPEKILKSMKIHFKSTSDFPGFIWDPDSGYSNTAEHSATKYQSMSVSAEVTIFDYFSWTEWVVENAKGSSMTEMGAVLVILLTKSGHFVKWLILDLILKKMKSWNFWKFLVLYFWVFKTDPENEILNRVSFWHLKIWYPNFFEIGTFRIFSESDLGSTNY